MYYCKTHDEKREVGCYSCWELLTEEKNFLLNACKDIELALKIGDITSIAIGIKTLKNAINFSENP